MEPPGILRGKTIRKIRILRPTRATELISAAAFDEIFARNLAPDCEVQQVPLTAWCDKVLGSAGLSLSIEHAAGIFSEETIKYDYLCPSYEGIELAPLFLLLRNRAGANIRLLFIAHSPAGCVMEWPLLRPLLSPGDLIVAPTNSAGETIKFLCPELAPFIEIIPHPMHLLPRDENSTKERIISLGRIDERKLLHRQIEAVAILRRRGVRLPQMQIAGPLEESGAAGRFPYARSLDEKIKRLKLEDCVRLIGPVYGDRDKARFISGARMMLNLSVTVEESFGKSPVEAMGLGVPVLATRWDGLPETIGPGGKFLQVHDIGQGLAVDVPAERIADVIESMMDDAPSGETCRRQAERFCPERVRSLYRSVLEERIDTAPGNTGGPDPFEKNGFSTAHAGGLLGMTAPLMSFSWREIFEFHLEDCGRTRKRWAGETVEGISDGEQLKSLLLTGTQKAMERFFAGIDYRKWNTAVGESFPAEDKRGDFIARISSASVLKAVRSSRQACLEVLNRAGEREMFNRGLEQLKREGFGSYGIDYLTAEKERQDGNFAKAFEISIVKKGMSEFDTHRLRQTARICREWKKPELALPYLRRWLEKYPDSPGSGPVWLDRCINAVRGGKDFSDEASHSYTRARKLLGNSPVIKKIRLLTLARKTE